MKGLACGSHVRPLAGVRGLSGPLLLRAACQAEAHTCLFHTCFVAQVQGGMYMRKKHERRRVMVKAHIDQSLCSCRFNGHQAGDRLDKCSCYTPAVPQTRSAAAVRPRQRRPPLPPQNHSPAARLDRGR